MNIDLRRTFALGGLGAALLFVTSMRHGPIPAAAATEAETIVAEWPAPSRRTALAMIEKHGQPNRLRTGSMTWYGLYRGRRTVVHRTDSRADVVEQVVLYRVPPEKAGAVALFDSRIKLDRRVAEMSARSESVRTNFLLLNLAHEVASGFRDVADAQALREREMRLAGSGKSSRYRDQLIFEEPLPARPGLIILPPTLKAQ